MTDLTLLENNLLFCSFQRIQIQQSQIMCKNERREVYPPKEYLNWLKCSMTCWGSTKYTPIQVSTSCQRELKVEQWIIRCYVVSFWPHPDTHNWESMGITPRCNKLSFVDHLLRKSRQAQIDTFRGTFLCHTASETASWSWISCLISIWYTPRYNSSKLNQLSVLHPFTFICIGCTTSILFLFPFFLLWICYSSTPF